MAPAVEAAIAEANVPSAQIEDGDPACTAVDLLAAACAHQSVPRSCASGGGGAGARAGRGPGDVTTGPGITNSIPLGETEEAAELVTAFEAATYQAEYVIHMGLLLMMPLAAEVWLEQSLMQALLNLLNDTLGFSVVFFLFSMQTKAYHFMYGLTYGRAAYVATGRGYAMDARRWSSCSRCTRSRTSTLVWR